MACPNTAAPPRKTTTTIDNNNQSQSAVPSGLVISTSISSSYDGSFGQLGPLGQTYSVGSKGSFEPNDHNEYTEAMNFEQVNQAQHEKPGSREGRERIRRRDSSTSDDEGGSSDEWDEEKERDDPVGDILTRMMNEGKIKHFGLPQYKNDNLLSATSNVVGNENDTCGDDGFKWSPLFTARNFRALRRECSKWMEWMKHDGENPVGKLSHQQHFIENCGNGKSCSSLKNHANDSHQIRFATESFFLVYFGSFFICDAILRSTSKFLFFSVLGSISSIFFDLEEVTYAILSVLKYILPHFLHWHFHRCVDLILNLLQVIEVNFLWGFEYRGRSIVWSDEERLPKFRWKHIRLMKYHHERRQNRIDRRKTRAERRRKEKKGIACDSFELEKTEQEMLAKEVINAAVEELRMKPPTFLPRLLSFKGDPAASLRCDATKQHLDSLSYCHNMIFFRERGHDEPKPVSITMRTDIGNSTSKAMNNGLDNSCLSPKEAIEVVDEFPDIGVNLDGRPSCSDSESTVASNSLSGQYGDYDDDDSSYYSGMDEESLLSYASESTAQSMDWLAVGAKIGHKILSSKQVQRVMANPEGAKKMGDEAKQLIDGMNDEGPISPSKASSWEANGFSNNQSLIEGLSESISVDHVPLPKRPMHRMWTSPSAAAAPSNSIRLATLNDSRIFGQVSSIDSLSQADNVSVEKCDADSIETKETEAGNRAEQIQESIEITRMLTFSEKAGYPNMLPPPSLSLGNGTDSYFKAPKITRLAPIEKGVKIVVPMFPPNTRKANYSESSSCFFQMGTVLSSSRLFVRQDGSTVGMRKRRLLKGKHQTNCLSIKLVLDKALLRGSKFAEMTIRILDEWNYVPRHSKFPVGSCVATSFGLGVLVGWRVEDDIHVIRSLWNRSGAGTGVAYLRRDSINSVVEAAVGFEVETRMGAGTVMGYVRGGKQNTNGKYFVKIKHSGRYRDRVMEFSRCQILSCRGATFIPVTEHIRAAALYQLEILHYKAVMRERNLNSTSKTTRNKGSWRNFSEYVDLFATSFSKAISEDPDFDREFDKYISYLIDFLDGKKDDKDQPQSETDSAERPSSGEMAELGQSHSLEGKAEAQIGWNINDMFGWMFVDSQKNGSTNTEDQNFLSQTQAFEEAHQSAFVLVRVLLKTIAVARASVPDRPKLHIALAMIHESLLFIRQILRVQKKNMSKKLIEAWFRTLNEMDTTFGPLKQRTATLGMKMAKKMKKHGDIAKKRILRFVDIILGDTSLLHALELSDWKQAIQRVEAAIVKAKITDAATCEQLHRGVVTMYKSLAPRKKDRKSKAAAARNGQKMVKFAKFVKVVASPGRSLLRVLTFDDVLDILDRILVRVFDKDPVCSMIINICAFNFHTIRHLRTLNNMAIAGKVWETVLDAVDEELNFAISEIPDQTKYFVDPLVKLFSLGVAKFHHIQSGESTADWLDFLMEEEAVEIIQELDLKFIDCLDSFCKDVKQVFEVLPYITTIDTDILNLMDELNFDLLFKEITDSLGDSEKFMAYVTERSAVIVERFLDYLPRMSIPIERRELPDGWVLTCRSKEGGDLRLSDIIVKRENLVCQVVGSDNVFRPVQIQDSYISSSSPKCQTCEMIQSNVSEESEDPESVLHEIKDLILSAQENRCWFPGMHGIREPNFFNGIPQVLSDLPLSDTLKTGIDLWQSSAITDFELLEIAIRDVSYQIQLQSENEANGLGNTSHKQNSPPKKLKPPFSSIKPFNPRVDPTVLFLDIKNLTLHLDEFVFRVEKDKPKTIFDPIFEGGGSLTVRNVSITLKVEVRKERVFKNGHETSRPVLQLEKMEVRLEKVKMMFKETGADWILNQVLKGFSEQITEVVEENLKEQIVKQVHIVLEHVNGFVDANPDLFIKILGITMKDLEENIIYV